MIPTSDNNIVTVLPDTCTDITGTYSPVTAQV